MKIRINPGGTILSLYTEDVCLNNLGNIITIKRASHVNANCLNQWEADMGVSGGPVLGPFSKRSEALEAEITWLNKNILR